MKRSKKTETPQAADSAELNNTQNTQPVLNGNVQKPHRPARINGKERDKQQSAGAALGDADAKETQRKRRAVRFLHTSTCTSCFFSNVPIDSCIDL